MQDDNGTIKLIGDIFHNCFSFNVAQGGVCPWLWQTKREYLIWLLMCNIIMRKSDIPAELDFSLDTNAKWLDLNI